MACGLYGDNPLSEPVMVHSQSDPKEHIHWNFTWNSKVYIQEHAYENVVCKSGGHLVSASMCKYGFPISNSYNSSGNVFTATSCSKIYIFTSECWCQWYGNQSFDLIMMVLFDTFNIRVLAMPANGLRRGKYIIIEVDVRANNYK